jgi:hypothetical protein
MEMHALKIENIDASESVLNEIAEVLHDLARDLGFNEESIYKLECRSRDGFIPHSWNMGGYGANGFTRIDDPIGSGMMTGSKKVNDLIQKYYDAREEEVTRCFLIARNLTELDTEDQELMNDYYNELSDSFCGDYDSINLNYQGRYLGYENGVHTISLNLFWSLTDAPYHRSSDDDIEVIIKFRSMDTKKFKKELEKAKDKLSDFIGSIELW